MAERLVVEANGQDKVQTRCEVLQEADGCQLQTTCGGDEEEQWNGGDDAGERQQQVESQSPC